MMLIDLMHYEINDNSNGGYKKAKDFEIKPKIDFHWQNFQGIASLLWFYSPRPTRFNSGENLMG